MKTKLLAISLLLFTSQVFSVDIYEAKILKIEAYRDGGTVALRVICIDGYKYLNTSNDRQNRANSTIQMFEERDGKSLPVRCN